MITNSNIGDTLADALNNGASFVTKDAGEETLGILPEFVSLSSAGKMKGYNHLAGEGVDVRVAKGVGNDLQPNL